DRCRVVRLDPYDGGRRRAGVDREYPVAHSLVAEQAVLGVQRHVVVPEAAEAFGRDRLVDQDPVPDACLAVADPGGELSGDHGSPVCGRETQRLYAGIGPRRRSPASSQAVTTSAGSGPAAAARRLASSCASLDAPSSRWSVASLL